MNLGEALLLVLIIFGCSLGSILLLAGVLWEWRRSSMTDHLWLVVLLLAAGLIFWRR